MGVPKPGAVRPSRKGIGWQINPGRNAAGCHRIGQRFECVVQLAEAIETKQQAAELIFPAEHTLDGVEPLFENGGVEKRFAASLESFSTAGIRVILGIIPRLRMALRLVRQS